MKGGNKSRPSPRSEDTAAQNIRDEIVHRDPDIGGALTRTAYGVHARGRQETNLTANR